MRRLSHFLICLVLCATPAFAQSLDNDAQAATDAIDEAINTYVTQFVANVPNLSNEQITDCMLVSNVLVSSALKAYGTDPKVDDMTMLAVTSQQQGWTTLYTTKSDSGADMNVGEAIKIYKSGDNGKAMAFTRTNIPVCGEIFKQAQLAAMASAGEKPR